MRRGSTWPACAAISSSPCWATYGVSCAPSSSGVAEMSPSVNPLRPQATPSAPTSGELSRAKIIETGSGIVHTVMYNPEELKLEQGAVFAEIPVPGLDTPPVQYVRGK